MERNSRTVTSKGEPCALEVKGELCALEVDSDDESLASPGSSRHNSWSDKNNTPSRSWLVSMFSPSEKRKPEKHTVEISQSWIWSKPRLRFDWKHLKENRTHEAHVQKEEVLWVVIITMGVAGMRTDILNDQDVEWYALHFFCFVRVVSASMKYASRFNDHDLAHQTLWALFTVGLLFQVQSLRGSYRYARIEGACRLTCCRHYRITC